MSIRNEVKGLIGMFRGMSGVGIMMVIIVNLKCFMQLCFNFFFNLFYTLNTLTRTINEIRAIFWIHTLRTKAHLRNRLIVVGIKLEPIKYLK